jgi:hypothetical protein
MKTNNNDEATVPTYEQWCDELRKSVPAIDANDPAIRATYDRSMEHPTVVTAQTPCIDTERLKEFGQQITDLWSWTPDVTEGVRNRVQAYKAVLKKYNDQKTWNPVSQSIAVKELKTKMALMNFEIQNLFTPGSKSRDDLFLEQLAVLEEVVHGVLQQRCKMTIAADPKIGKTWLVLALAYSIATGTKWMNHLQCMQGRVLYINLELIEQELKRRCKIVEEDLGFEDLESIPRLKVWTLRVYPDSMPRCSKKRL